MFAKLIEELGPRPPDNASRVSKRNYAQRLSGKIAETISADLRRRGLENCVPDPGGSGEHTFAGGIGSKKVDVSWALKETGLLLGLSIKTINHPDGRSKNYQKNLTNRRGDMLFESVTLHRRFPYAVLGGFLFLHEGANQDDTDRRQSTFLNAHDRFRIFTNREDPGDREEQYEQLYIALYSAMSPYPVQFYPAGDSTNQVTWEDICQQLLSKVAERNPDHFAYSDGRLTKRP